MKKTLFTLIVCLISVMPGLTGYLAGAQSIGQAELKEIQGSFVKDASTKALQNALTHDRDIKSFTYNLEKDGQIDHFFKRKPLDGLPLRVANSMH